MNRNPRLRCADSGRIWQQMPLRSIPGTLPLPEEFIALARVCTRILDVGCGVGSAAEELPTGSLLAWVGVDINRGAIAVAKKRRYLNTDFRIHDARKPLPHIGKFDLFLLKGLLTCMPTHQEQLAVLRQLKLHAAKRRVFVIVDFLQNWDHVVYRRRYEGGLRAGLEKGTFLAPNANGSSPAFLAHHFEYPEMIRLLTEAGLRVVCAREILVRTRTGNETRGFVLIAD